MRFIRHSMLKKSYTPTVATIGAYDGVHLGHQQVLNILKKKAKDLNVLATVICFEPLPKEFFLGENSPPRITLLRDKVKILKQLGIDQFVCIRFDADFSGIEAEDFISKILVESLNIRHLVVGDDFRFGKKRIGDFALLNKMGSKFGFSVDRTHSYKLEGRRISSSLIRQTIQHGNLAQAKLFLGRDYAISGRVQHGKKLGRTIGFPTINIALPHDVVVNGVYVVSIEINDVFYTGVASVGLRPTVCGKIRLLEVYIFKFNQQIYGEHVKVTFLNYLRSEIKFDSVMNMMEQIKLDEQDAHTWLKEYY